MFRVVWDKDINGVLLTTNGNGDALNVSPRPVFHEELSLLGFDKNFNWRYQESNSPLLWALDRRYYYKGELVAEVKGGNIFDDPKIEISEAGKELKLKPINIQKVVEKNQKLLFLLEQEAIEFIEQTYRTYSLKKIRSKAKANEEVDWALLAEMHEKNTKIKHAVVKQDCDSFDIMPLDLAKENNKTVYLNTKIDQFIASILKEEDIYFAIIGDGHDVEMLKNKKEVLALDKVCFFPFVNQNIIGKIIEKSKCCIGAIQDKPIYRFGLSLNKLNDYLISGKPVVFACNYDNVVKDAGQFAIPSDAPDVMAETLKKIRSLDSDSLVELAENSKALIKEQYDYKVVSENYLKLLASL